MAIESETFVSFDGIYWWLSSMFKYRDRTYCHLMREDLENSSAVVNYAELEDELSLSPVPPKDWEKIAMAYKGHLLSLYRSYGEDAFPIVGVKLYERVRAREEDDWSDQGV